MDKEAYSEMDDEDDDIDDSTGDVDADTRTFVSTHLIFSHLLDFDKKKNTLSELNAQNKERMLVKGVLNYSKYQHALNQSQLNESRSYSRSTYRNQDLFFMNASGRVSNQLNGQRD